MSWVEVEKPLASVPGAFTKAGQDGVAKAPRPSLGGNKWLAKRVSTLFYRGQRPYSFHSKAISRKAWHAAVW